MHPLVKLIIGVILLVLPLGLYAYELMNPGASIYGDINLVRSLYIVLQGIIPPFLIVMGLFIIWLELDEWRIEKELKSEEKKEKKKTKTEKSE